MKEKNLQDVWHNTVILKKRGNKLNLKEQTQTTC